MKVSDLLEPELQTVKTAMWVMGIETRSPVRVASAFSR